MYTYVYISYTACTTKCYSTNTNTLTYLSTVTCTLGLCRLRKNLILKEFLRITLSIVCLSIATLLSLLMKWVAYVHIELAAMLSETIHSLVDMLNQVGVAVCTHMSNEVGVAVCTHMLSEVGVAVCTHTHVSRLFVHWQVLGYKSYLLCQSVCSAYWQLK